MRSVEMRGVENEECGKKKIYFRPTKPLAARVKYCGKSTSKLSKCCRSSNTAEPSVVKSTKLSYPWSTFSSSISFNISNSHAKRSFPSWTHSSVIFAHSTVDSSMSMALRFVAAFVLPRGLAKQFGDVIRMR